MHARRHDGSHAHQPEWLFQHVDTGRNTAIGAGIGAVGGAVLTGGSTMGTVGSAAIGGIIGHEAR